MGRSNKNDYRLKEKEILSNIRSVDNPYKASTIEVLKELIKPNKITDFDMIHFIDGAVGYMFKVQQNQLYQIKSGRLTLINEVQLNTRIMYLGSLGYKIKSVRFIKEDNNNVMVVIFG